MKTARCLLLVVSLCLGLVPVAAAQSAAFRHDLLALLPDDFAVCAVMHDLQGHNARWEQSAWLKTFKRSPLGKTLLDTPELKQLARWEADLKKHFDVDWPALRDDFLGDTLILSYSPGPKDKSDEERGLILVHLRGPERFHHFLKRLNQAQTKSGELSSLTALMYKSRTYYRRVQSGKPQYFAIDGSLVAISAQEDVLRGFLDKRGAGVKDSPWATRFQRAGADRAFATICVNPRMLEPDFGPSHKNEDSLPSYWRALEAIFVTLTVKEDAEVRVVIQANTAQLPRWARSSFTETSPASTLWQRFPRRSLFTFASQTDFAGTAETLKLVMPEKDRKNLAHESLRLGALLELDLFRDLLPNIGPDWGVCILPAKDAKQLPRVLFALAVKPGSKEAPVDQALIKAAGFFAKLAVLNNPEAMRVQSVLQDKIEIKYLTSDTLFPPGVQPAWALKDGFLLLASSPEAIASFRLQEGSSLAPRETPLFRVSTPELARLLEQRRQHILDSLIQRQQMSERTAKQHLANVISLLDLFDQVTLSQQGTPGQATWIIRVSPK